MELIVVDHVSRGCRVQIKVMTKVKLVPLFHWNFVS